ncbi:MAG: hypothetical protein K6F09_06435, partial [Clostridiales bacterium]|nr:hypothetical protein [Clostridiales bacterium]
PAAGGTSPAETTTVAYTKKNATAATSSASRKPAQSNVIRYKNNEAVSETEINEETAKTIYAEYKSIVGSLPTDGNTPKPTDYVKVSINTSDGLRADIFLSDDAVSLDNDNWITVPDSLTSELDHINTLIG